MISHLHKLARRGSASWATIAATRKLSKQKACLMLLLAFRILQLCEWKVFKATFDHIRDRTVKITKLTLQLPLANTKSVKRRYVDVLRDAL